MNVLRDPREEWLRTTILPTTTNAIVRRHRFLLLARAKVGYGRAYYYNYSVVEATTMCACADSTRRRRFFSIYFYVAKNALVSDLFWLIQSLSAPFKWFKTTCDCVAAFDVFAQSKYCIIFSCSRGQPCWYKGQTRNSNGPRVTHKHTHETNSAIEQQKATPWIWTEPDGRRTYVVWRCECVCVCACLTTVLLILLFSRTRASKRRFKNKSWPTGYSERTADFNGYFDRKMEELLLWDDGCLFWWV